MCVCVCVLFLSFFFFLGGGGGGFGVRVSGLGFRVLEGLGSVEGGIEMLDAGIFLLGAVGQPAVRGHVVFRRFPHPTSGVVRF